MANFREIVTKAVIGKAKKTSGSTFKLETEEKPDTILGCWVINNVVTLSDKVILVFYHQR